MHKKYIKYLWTSILTIYFLLATFAYIIVPDKSINANTQILSLALKPMGFKTYLIKKTLQPDNSNIIIKTLLGSREIAIYYPVKSPETITIRNDTLFFLDQNNKQKFILKENTEIIERNFLLGTDNLGRDFLSRVILGSRVSLFVGISAMLLSAFVGFLLGSIAGFVGGKIDNILQWLMGTLWTLPSILLALILSFVLGTGIQNLIITITLVSWIDTARIIRGKVIELKNREFIHSARALGIPDFRILIKHIFPNLWETLTIVSISTLSSAILLEAGLSFLGFGVEPPTPSWGLLISENYPYLMIENLQHLAIVPGIAIAGLILTLFGIYNSFKY